MELCLKYITFEIQTKLKTVVNDTSKEQPLVSIAMCTFNGERFLSKQLTSILTQTYLNIEVVIVDDCSNDDTVRIIEEFKQRDNRIKYFINESNLGFSKNFEKAITLCSGSFIAISDQDDIWLSNKIERLLNSIKENLMVYANSAIIDDNDMLTGTTMINPSREEFRYLSFKSILLQNFVSGHNLLFRKEALEFVMPFPKSGFYDWWMAFVMLYEQKLSYCNEVLTHYRLHSSSVINILTVSTLHDKTERLRKECENIVEHLMNFQHYKSLKSEDLAFLRSLEMSIQDKVTSYHSTKLFRFLLKNSRSVYPGYIKGGIKRIAFIYRSSRGVKLFKLLGSSDTP
jgi:glycosyltransferase involved in cell wall biosynthesis